MSSDTSYMYLRSANVGIVLDFTGGTLPRILHWGDDLGDLGPAGSDQEQQLLAAFATSVQHPPANAMIDVPTQLALIPEQAHGWLGTPGLTGHRNGSDFSTRFEVTSVTLGSAVGEGIAATSNQQVLVSAQDQVAGLGLEIVLELLPSGVVRQRATVTNTAAASAYTLSGLTLSLPLPPAAQEIMDFTGRWIRERAPQRKPFTYGTHTREVRRGRAHDATLVVLAGEENFSNESGQVWGVHVGWSGNSHIIAERVLGGFTQFLGGELLLAGEVILAPGQSYESPWLYGSYGSKTGGINELSNRFHQVVRSRPLKPKTERPVHINVWEAVYFDHDLDKLKELADLAAQVGVERYILDDGWFRHRRHDRAGLGDWYVDEGVWPNGLDPIISHVRGLGMQFGLWFEPEMINVDSDLARSHPEWIMAPNANRLPIESRQQQVLNIAIDGAYNYILERIDALLTQYPIDYIKWDHNRDLIEAGNQLTGQAAYHDQTVALYRLLGELKERHPGVEIETCSGGGARVDLGILAYTDRMWTSDCNDALERQLIESGTGILLPPEILGSHVGAERSHTTGRRHDLSFRAATAMFGSMGVEWDLTQASENELAELEQWIALFKTHRDLLHSGTVVRQDGYDPAIRVRAVVSQAQDEALFAVTQLATGLTQVPGRTKLFGLDPKASYTVTPIGPNTGLEDLPPAFRPLWWHAGTTLPGTMLMSSGLQLPSQFAEHTQILHVTQNR